MSDLAPGTSVKTGLDTYDCFKDYLRRSKDPRIDAVDSKCFLVAERFRELNEFYVIFGRCMAEFSRDLR